MHSNFKMSILLEQLLGKVINKGDLYIDSEVSETRVCTNNSAKNQEKKALKIIKRNKDQTQEDI